MMAIDEKKPAKRGLGRGLSALFEDDEDQFGNSEAKNAPETRGDGRRMAGIHQLEAGFFQPRQIIDPEGIEELAASIKAHGILQPILVRPVPDTTDQYEIIAGERRWHAAQMAGLHEVPVVIRTLTNVQALEIALIENLQRIDLNALDEAQGFKRLSAEFGHTQEKLAEVLGKSRSYIANALRLLSLSPEVQRMVQEGKLTAGHARALVTAPDDVALARDVVARNLSVRETEKLVADTKAPAKKAWRKDVDTAALERDLSNALGLTVTIDSRDGKSGSVKVKFKSLDQLDHVARLLAGINKP